MSGFCKIPISGGLPGLQQFPLAFPPEGFEILKRGNNTYLVGRNCHPLLDFLLKDQQITKILNAIKPDISAGGRGETVTINIPGPDAGRGVLRKGLRGGIFKKILGRTYWGRFTRMFEEALISDYALCSGLPVPEILLAGREPLGPFCYRGWLITREIQNSQNLADYFRQCPVNLSDQNRSEIENILQNLAEIVSKMHDKNIIHADLHVKNILVQNDNDGKKQIFLIDFDKSKVVRQMTIKQRLNNIMRLFRSFKKQPGLSRFLDHETKINFLTIYFHGDKNKIQRAEQMLRQERWRYYFHRFGWHIEGHKHG